MTEGNNLAIIDGLRTPFCKAGTELRGAMAADMASHVFREVMDRSGLDPALVDEVILGCAGPAPNEANVARVAALRAGLPQSVPALTVMRNCGSGMEALFTAEVRMRAGQGEVFLVGGAESMSNYPLLMNEKLKGFFEKMFKAKSPVQKLRLLASFRPSFLKPRVAILEGLRDPVSGLMMGNTAENLARRFGIQRLQQDNFALQSHLRAAAAQESGRLQQEISPLTPPPAFKGMVKMDNGIRAGQSMTDLQKLRPVFDKQEGDVTVGNACQVTDGAVGMLVMQEDKARSLGLQPLAIVRGSSRAGLDPAQMGLGPVHAAPKALKDAGLMLQDIDLFEINEAFAAQVLACQEAFASDLYCQQELGMSKAMGEISSEKLNVNGGAIALGHPIGATGARLVLSMAKELQASGKQFGMVSLCVGGGQGQAFVLEVA